MLDNGYCLARCSSIGRPEDKTRGHAPVCLIMSIEHTRWKFRKTSPESASNIDSHIGFRSPTDIRLYIPRAIQIGLLAPFPTMWFSSGRTTGRLGRWIAGAETGLMYVGLLLAAFGVWKERRNPAVWLISFFIFSGITLLGMVVINIGALYRHRYIFWFLLIIFAVQGFKLLRERPPGRGGLRQSDLFEASFVWPFAWLWGAYNGSGLGGGVEGRAFVGSDSGGESRFVF